MPPPTNATAKLVAKLEGLVLRRQRQVDELTSQQRKLLARVTAAQIAVHHCEALLQLGAALSSRSSTSNQRSNGRTQSGSADAGDGVGGIGSTNTPDPSGPSTRQNASGGSNPVNACPESDVAHGAGGTPSRPVAPSGPLPPWQAQLLEMIQQLGAQDEFQQGQLPEVSPAVLYWSAQDAAASIDSQSLTTEGLRQVLCDSIKQAACLLPRVRDKAPNHDAALATLRQTHKRLSEFVALLGVAPPESQAALSNVLLNRLDRPTLQPAQQQEGEQPLVPGLPASALRGRSGAHTQPPAERPPPGHFEWAVTQLALEPEQEELAVALLSLSYPRISQLLAQREQLLQLMAASPNNTAKQELLLRELNCVQSCYQCTSVVFLLAFSSVIRTDQFFTWMVSAFPWVPSLASLHTTLLHRGAKPAEQAGLNEPVKRGRGRPRKKPAEPEAPQYAADAAVALDAELAFIESFGGTSNGSGTEPAGVGEGV